MYCNPVGYAHTCIHTQHSWKAHNKRWKINKNSCHPLRPHKTKLVTKVTLQLHNSFESSLPTTPSIFKVNKLGRANLSGSKALPLKTKQNKCKILGFFSGSYSAEVWPLILLFVIPGFMSCSQGGELDWSNSNHVAQILKNIPIKKVQEVNTSTRYTGMK